MGKAIVLKIVAGDFDSGFPVVLQVLDERGGLPLAERSGYLPPHPHLEGYYFNWQTSFRSLTSQRGRDWGIDPDLPSNVSNEYDIEACREYAKLLEKNMKEWLRQTVDAGCLNIRERLIEDLAENRGNVRITIQANPKLWKMPWLEWDILSKYPDLGIGFSPLEYQKPDSIARSGKQGAAVRILAVFGNNENIDLTPDKQAIAQLPNVELESLEQPSAAKVIQKLRDKRGWDIFFFAGHSQTKGDEGIIYINERDSLEIGQFKEALKEAIRQGLQLAIFNSCDGLGLAEKLAGLQLPIAIVMKEPVPDRVAQRFLTEFLKEYAAGAYLYTAVRRSQNCLEEFAATEFPGCTGLPIVCQNPAEVPPTWEELRGKKPIPPVPPDPIPIPPSPPRWQKLRRALAASLAIALFVLGAQWQGKLETWEIEAFDHLMRQLPLEEADDRLLIVGADIEDLDRYDFPLPDAILAQLIEKLQQYQPSVIGLNILRKEPEKSPQYPGGEQAFANQLKTANNIITVCQLGNRIEESYPPITNASINKVGFSDFMRDYLELRYSNIRRYLLTRTDNKIVTPSQCKSEYSFAFLLAYEHLERQGIPVELVGESWKFGSTVAKPLETRTGGYQNLDASGNQLLIRYRHTQNPSDIAQQVTVRDVLTDSPTFDPGWVKDRIVLIGVTSNLDAPDEDTPYGKIPRLHIHAHVVSQILSAADGDRPFLWWWPQWGNMLWIFAWSLAGTFVVSYFKEAFHQWLGITGFIFLLYSLSRFALTQSGWIPLIPPGLALVLSALTLLFYNKIKKSVTKQSNN